MQRNRGGEDCEGSFLNDSHKDLKADYVIAKDCVLTPGRYVEELKDWKSQIAISNKEKMGLRKPPLAFTEQGVAMPSVGNGPARS